MGVIATYCQLCGLPAQHDHYVPTGGDLLRIYRGATSDEDEGWDEDARPFAFGPQHAWLLDAVAVPFGDDEAVVRGAAEDGAMGDGLFVARGDDEALVFHHACWTLMDRPGRVDAVVTAVGTRAWAEVDAYQEQLFEFFELEADGRGWMLDDPSGSERSRARLETLLLAGRTRREAHEEPSSLEDLIACDRDWRSLARRDHDHSRRQLLTFRTGPRQGLDLSRAPHGLTLRTRYPGDGLPDGAHLEALEGLHRAAQHALEHDGLGLAVASQLGGGQSLLVAYAREPVEARRRLEALETFAATKSALEVEPDASWATYFERLELPRG